MGGTGRDWSLPEDVKPPYVVDLPTFSYSQKHVGHLTVVEGGHKCPLPFVPMRSFWITDIPAGVTRGDHAHKDQFQAIVAVSGRFVVDVSGYSPLGATRWQLTSPSQALVIPPMNWTLLRDFSLDAVALVFTNGWYDESDYFRDKDKYMAAFKKP